MTSPLTVVRHGLADAAKTVVPQGTAVAACPQSATTAPAVTVLAGEATPVTGCLWAVTWTLQIVGPGGDNEAGLSALEDLVTRLVAAIHATYLEAVLTVHAPALTIIAGTAYLTQDLDVVLQVPIGDMET